MEIIHLSKEGAEKLQQELHRLKTIDRMEVVREIKRAREFGDLSENAEYHAAKEKQVFIERKIAELEDQLTRVRIIEAGDIDASKAYLLSTVKLRDCRNGEELEYTLVSAEEADIDNNKISIKSPIGRGLLGKSAGDKVQIQVPAGMIEYEILAVTR
jgi:transcription elongation factor GreA